MSSGFPDRTTFQTYRERMDPIRPDIDAAISKMPSKVGGKRELKKLPEHLWEGEQVSILETGQYGAGMGIMALTDRRLLFLKDGIMSQTSEDFPFDKISSIQWSSGMMFGKIAVFVSGNKAEITNVGKAQGKAIVDAVRNRISAASGPAAPAVSVAPPAPVSEDPVEQIQKLAGLRDAGILTEDEFSAKKAQILGI